MRAWEILENRRPRSETITICDIHKQKREDKLRAASHEKRMALLPVMYSSSQWEREMLEIQRMRLELDQLRAEIAATNAEARAKTWDKISDMARSGMKAENQTEEKITAMAKRGLAGC